MSFKSVEEVAAWAETHGGDDGLRTALAGERFGNNPRSIAYAKEWLRQQEAARDQVAGDLEQALRTREVRAAEASAEAAQRSATEAKRSARWAMWATVIAIVAVIVSVAKS